MQQSKYPSFRFAFIGDSHVGTLKSINHDRLHLPNIQMHFLSYPGATARGLRPKAQGERPFNKILDQLNIYGRGYFDVILTQFGEIDCGYKIWVNAIEHSTNVNQTLEQSVTTYIKFVNDYLVPYSKRICITATALPTLQGNDAHYGSVATMRSSIRNKICQRTALTVQYNDRMKELAAEYGFDYLDAQRPLLNTKTQQIHPEFLNDDRGDHHHGPMVIPIWLAEIRAFCIRNNIEWN